MLRSLFACMDVVLSMLEAGLYFCHCLPFSYSY